MHRYPTSSWPKALLPFCQGLACGLTKHPDHCMLEIECIYDGLVCMFFAFFFRNPLSVFL